MYGISPREGSRNNLTRWGAEWRFGCARPRGPQTVTTERERQTKTVTTAVVPKIMPKEEFFKTDHWVPVSGNPKSAAHATYNTYTLGIQSTASECMHAKTQLSLKRRVYEGCQHLQTVVSSEPMIRNQSGRFGPDQEPIRVLNRIQLRR